MTGLTPLYSIPYPVPADQVADLDTILQDQAEQIESTIAGLGGVASPGSWNSPSLASGWASLGAPYMAAGYRKVVALYLRGTLVRSVSTYTAVTTVFTLPVGFRPTATVLFPADTGGAHIQVGITSAGAVFFGSNVAIGGSVTLTSPPIWLD